MWAAAHLKLRDRAVGALLGVPAGIGFRLLLPYGPIAYDTLRHELARNR